MIQPVTQIILVAFLLFTAVPMAKAETLVGEADHTPWSGHWWPSVSGELVYGYDGTPSPFNKYDLYTSGVSNGPLTSWGHSNINVYNPSAKGWWGLCHAWASAALLEPFDFEPSVESGIYFAVGDKKGLLTATHIEDPVILADCNSDPLYFHLFLVEYVGQQKIGMVCDLDSSEEVWSHPIYKYSGTITHSSNSDTVSVTIYYADDNNTDPDYKGTKVRTKVYHYVLYKTNGAYTSGEWINDSTTDHPETCWIPLESSPPSLLDYDLVREIAQSSQENIQAGGIIIPGHHVLLLNSEESTSFSIDRPDGATNFRLFFALNNQRLWESGATFSISNSSQVFATGSLQEKITAIDLSELSGDAVLQFIPTRPVTGPEPIVIHVYYDYDLKNTVYMPGYEDSYWKGLAVANLSESVTSNYVNIITYDSIGLPRSQYGPSYLGKNNHWVGLMDAIAPKDTLTDNKIMGVKIASSKPIAGTLLTGFPNSLYGPPSTQEDSEITTWCIPVITKNFSSDTSQYWITNTSNTSTQVVVRPFSNSGSAVSQTTFNLEPLASKRFYPGEINVNGFALIDDPEHQLKGAVHYSLSSSLGEELPFLSGQQEWLVAHPAIYSGWTTELVLINMADERVQANLELVTPDLNNYNKELDLAAHERKSFALSGSIWNASDDLVNASSISITASNNITGYIIYRYLDTLFATVPLAGANDISSTKLIPHMASNAGWWTGIVIRNTVHKDIALLIRGFDQQGNEVERTSRNISSLDKLVTLGSDLFPQTIEQIATIRITATAPVAGLILFGDPELNFLTAQIL